MKRGCYIMTFRKVVIEKTKEVKEIKLAKVEIAQFVNVADCTNFVALVEKRILAMQRNEYAKTIGTINDKLFSGEIPTEEDKEKAEDAKVAIELIDKTLEKLNPIATDNDMIISIVACFILKKSYYLPVAELDKLLRKFQSVLINEKGTLVLDESVRSVFSEIKKTLATTCECYNTSKDSTFKEFKPRFNDRLVINLCQWFYNEIKLNATTGCFEPNYRTDTSKDGKINYSPLQSEVQKMVMSVMQSNNK